jgi:hypothetical protein
MKHRSTRLIIITLFIITIVAGCTTPATQPSPTQVPPTQQPATQASPDVKTNSEVVLNMVERMNAGDAEGSLAFFADNARVYMMGFPPTEIEIYTGKDQIRLLWEDSVANHFEWDVEIGSTYGDIVNVKAKTWHDFTSQLGVAPLEYTDVYEIKDGKIVTYGSWLTQESLARFRPALAEVMPPEPTALPSSDPPVSEITVTISGGRCNTDNSITLRAGEVTVNLSVEDQDKSMYALTLFNLAEGKDFLDLMAETVTVQPSWAHDVLYRELGPGKSETYTFTIEKGPVYLVCWSKPPDIPIGNAGPFTVAP